MTLLQLEYPLSPDLANELSCLLEEDVVAFSWYENKQLEWISQLIFEGSQEVKLKNKISKFFNENGLKWADLHSSPVQERDWLLDVYKNFPPLYLGKFYIYGLHIQEALPKDMLPLCINAATAFGSGQHESTEGCLRALSELAEQYTFSQPLDMGCGSGILALAMASLWKVPVIACDNDIEAVRITQQNAHVNHLEAYVKPLLSEGFSIIQNQSFDLITANIMARPLCQMAGDMLKALSFNGFIILSGLLNSQAEGVIDVYRSHGVKLVDQLFIGDWSTLIMRKENRG
ncbi:MAG: ribosomal protein L11 methyltransferase [uncultured bacterium]|nr:MAG: ribosomal protein L11 methyltransferase [uncultured bacterium]OFW67965.1 MAG: hypothetical protein A2X70_07505 [Alphaproteobacteria bacterium GWC2_42_16]OFW74667.1 MAG: hypothetical protein A2Z80_00665 [Alphaproteobacteria bacterium GWA2_41_27]OFW84972.1 MAG: hypothetical protein A3E50_03045 [Alphaproteobacteria bacterium RIFCSPHIGHO2_12_FULL_42_100]OFW85561.1 MAG: hypothetical protein A2W06_03095 [Alphaproteobacteria bacterium RBG_16_42_14]OFW92101.1 MAG: hypothetical protein A2W46_06